MARYKFYIVLYCIVLCTPEWHSSSKQSFVDTTFQMTMGGDLVVSLGGTGRRVSAEKIFSPSPPTFEIWGGQRSDQVHYTPSMGHLVWTWTGSS